MSGPVPNLLHLPQNPQQQHPLRQKIGADGLCIIRQAPSNIKKFHQTLRTSSCTHGGDSSWKQYRISTKWKTFCAQRGLCVLQSTVNQVLEFMTMLFDTGLGYSSLSIARSALSAVFSLPGLMDFGRHPLIVKFLRQV